MVPGNDKSNALWEEFFRNQNVYSSTKLRNIWGRAEQTATDYGVSKSWGRAPTLREWGVKSITDMWRFAVANGDGISNFLDRTWCQLIAVCAPIPRLYHFLRDPLIDPRSSPTVIRTVFDALWTFLGSVPCAWVFSLPLSRYLRLC